MQLNFTSQIEGAIFEFMTCGKSKGDGYIRIFEHLQNQGLNGLSPSGVVGSKLTHIADNHAGTLFKIAGTFQALQLSIDVVFVFANFLDKNNFSCGIKTGVTS